MDTHEMKIKIDVTLPDTPKALGDWANNEINNIISIVEFIRQLQKELNKTDLKVENIKLEEVKNKFAPFITFELSKNLVVSFCNGSMSNGNEITIRIEKMVKLEKNKYIPRFLYESVVRCPYIGPWKHLRYQGISTPIPTKYKHDVDTLIYAINKVVKDNSVEKINM